MPSPPILGELALIQQLHSRARGSRHLKLGIGDDCAILALPRGHELLVTTDFSLEGRHFRRDWHPARSAGHRCLARGLSDLAAMGAEPLAAFLSLAVPRSLARNPSWLHGFLDGLLALAAAHRVPLAGGDSSESPAATNGDSYLLADIVLTGSAPAGRALRRSGAFNGSKARPGDRLYVTGTLGGAATELAALAADPRRFRHATAAEDHPHLFPQPRLAVGRALLRRRLATACIDLSDGLSTDLDHLCAASTVAAELDAAALPLHPLARALSPEQALQAALHGGEDYELLFTASAATRVPHSIAGVAITCIGRIVKPRKPTPTSRKPTPKSSKPAPRVTLIETLGTSTKPHRTPLAPGGWQHLT